jgi:hypothetical protein
VRDDGGTANGGVDTAASANTITFGVTPVNDAPAGVNNTVVTLEDTGYTFTDSDFGFSDTHDTPSDNFIGVRITTLPTAGTLTLNGVAVTAGQVVLESDIAGGLLVFTPSLNGNGTGYSSFTFQVQDDGGTGNGGADTDPVANTMTIDVTPVNDAPTDIGLSKNWFPMGSHTGDLVANLSTNDPDNDNSTMVYSIVGSPSIFALVGDKLVLTSSPNPHTAPKTYTITLRADDGQYTVDKTFTIYMGNPAFILPDETPVHVRPDQDWGPTYIPPEVFTPIHNAFSQIRYSGDGLGNLIATSFLTYGEVQVKAFYGNKVPDQGRNAVDATLAPTTTTDTILRESTAFESKDIGAKPVATLGGAYIENASDKPHVREQQAGVEEWIIAYHESPLYKAMMAHKAGADETPMEKKITDVDRRPSRDIGLQLDEAALYYQSKEHKLFEALTKRK